MKIFVSSTYIDLVAYRNAVERAINLLEQQFVGMEYFGALSDEPKHAALDKVAQCEVFVGIYAHRYGFIPDGDRKSITEQEFDRAQNLGKTIFCYRVKPDQPWNPKMIEGGDAQTKLDSFLKRIDKQYVRQEFTTPEDLLAKVSADLARHLSSSGVQATIAHPLPPVPYYVHSYPLQANFTGRETELGTLNDWFTREPQSVFVLDAIGGMGKSALAWVWTQDIFSLGAPAAGVLWWSFYDPQGRNLSSFLDKALSYASHGAQNGKSFASDRERIDALLAQLRDKRFLFMLDGFERMMRAYARMDAAYRGDEFDVDERNDFRACTDPNAGILLRGLAVNAGLTRTLITTRLMPRELDELESVHHVELKGLNPDDAVKFFERQGIKGSRAEIENACSGYGFHPLSLRLLSSTLASDPRYKRDIKFAPRVNPLDQDKERKMLDFAYNSLPPRQQKLISQLAAFRNPISWDAIAGIFASKENGTHMNADERGKEENPRQPASIRVQYSEDELAHFVTELIQRSLVQRNSTTETYDLHPVVRRYCYDRLGDKRQIHIYLRNYFVANDTNELLAAYEKSPLGVQRELNSVTWSYGRFKVPASKYMKVWMAVRKVSPGLAKIFQPKKLAQVLSSTHKVESIDDLQSAIELYHHSLCAGYYDEAIQFFRYRLSTPLYYQLGAYQTCIQLLGEAFTNGDYKQLRTKEKGLHAWILDLLGNAYANSGQPRLAMFLYSENMEIHSKLRDMGSLAAGLISMALLNCILGNLKNADEVLRSIIDIRQPYDAKYWEVVSRRELGQVFIYCGKYEEAEAQFENVLRTKSVSLREQSIVHSYRAYSALLTTDATIALKEASTALQFAEEYERTHYSHIRDFVRAERLIGSAFSELARNALDQSSAWKIGRWNESEHHLLIALARDRRINWVEEEAPILLEFAKLRMDQARMLTTDDRQQTTGIIGHVDAMGSRMDEALQFANEALSIADRCEYRLQQAEIHNFLAEWHWQRAQWVKGEMFLPAREGLKQKVREHAERAKERAWCDGPPYYYKVAWEKAEKVLQTINSTYSTDSS